MDLSYLDIETYRLFSEKLMNWYEQNKRNLPWRNTFDPYKIWVSEVILQQTRVKQGIDYYQRFISTFPTVYKLAQSSEEDVLRLWQGLGYYSRARNIHKGAKKVVSMHNGILPNTYKELLAINSIGEYTAAAILSIAHNKAHATVDGNVYRVLSRFFAIDIPIDSSAGRRLFQDLAQKLLDKSNPGKHNQAIMEFGALICKPVQPLCDLCPLQIFCVAEKNGAQSDYPVKSRKVKVRKRYFNYFVIEYKGYILLRKRTDNDIWKNMYEFPLIETKQKMNLHELKNHDAFHSLFQNVDKIIDSNIIQVKHILSHQHIFAVFYNVQLSSLSEYLKCHFIQIKRKNISSLPVSTLIHRGL